MGLFGKRKRSNPVFVADIEYDGKMCQISLPRFLMDCVPGDGKVVEHINGNPLDCRKENLRISPMRDKNVI